MKGYDHVATIYDRLSRLVYGNAIVAAQQYAVGFIPAGSRVLIVGGGTGWILEEISKVHASDLNITYVEASEKMLRLAERRNVGRNKVKFVHARIEDMVETETYDVVVTPFLFDNFNETEAEKIFKNTGHRLMAGALWLYVDFKVTAKNGWWQKRLLKAMFLFFRLAGVVKITGLPPMDKFFSEGGFEVVASKTFYKTFIATTIYRRKS